MQITAVPNIAEMVGVNRIVVGQAVPYPCGNPKLADPAEEKKLRKKFVKAALDLLQQEVSEVTVVKVD